MKNATVEVPDGRVKVLLVDDQEVIREAFGMLISGAHGRLDRRPAGWRGSRTDGAGAEVVVMDVKMPGMNGVAAAHQIRTQPPEVGIILLSAYDDFDYITEFLKDDPKGKAYLLKHTLSTMDELIRTIHDVASGRTVLDPIMVEKLTARRGSQRTRL